MKKILGFYCFMILLIPFSAQSQDTILLNDNSKVGCTVVKVGSKYIEYTKYRSTEDIYFTINRNLVQYIFYNSGFIDTFNPVVPSPILPEIGDTAHSIPYFNSFEKGREDAHRLYRNSFAGVANGAAGLILMYGIPMPIIWSFVKVNPENISVPEYVTSSDKEYKRGFEKGASQKMHKQAWRSYGVGAGIGAVAIVGFIIYLGFY